ncbi:putative ERG2/sigma1 receptor [Arabidopsis thaliana]
MKSRANENQMLNRETMKGKILVSPSEKSMTSSTTITTTTTTVSTEDWERRDSNCYFPDCRKDANCSCEICLDSLNATLDLMPLSVQKSSLTKLSSASNFKSTVESTPTSFDPTVVTTPASVSRPILKLMISSPKKKLTKKSKVFENEEQRKTTKKERRLLIVVFLKVILVIGLVLGLELGFSWVLEEVFKPEFTEEIVRNAYERTQADLDLGVKLRLLEDELKVFVNNGKFSSCTGSDSKWKINQDGPMLNSKCVLSKSAIEEVSIWGWPLQTSGLFHTGFSSSSITVLSGRVTEWTEGKFGYSIHETNTSWGKTKWSTSVLQLDPNTWVLEYSQSSVMDDSSSLLSLTIDIMKHLVFRVAKNVNRELYWMFSSSRRLYREAESKASAMTPT